MKESMTVHRVSLVLLSLSFVAAGCGQSSSESKGTKSDDDGDDRQPREAAAGAESDAGGGGRGNDDSNGAADAAAQGDDDSNGAIATGDFIPGLPTAEVGDGGPGPGVTPGAGSIEDSCDGIDNDENGIIDDVDVGHDGICDCLLIATLGQPGTWGDGDVFATWLDSRSANGATDLADTVLTPEVLAPYHIIVVQDVSVIGRSYEPSEVEALQAWVEAGGGLMTLIGYADPDERINVNTLLEPFDIQYGEQQIAQRQGNPTLPIGVWATHPITEGIEFVGSDNGYPVDGDDATSTVIAQTDDGHPFGRVAMPGTGHVFVWGDEWITYNSEWVEHEDYQVELFWVNTIKWLTVSDECQVPVPATIPRAPIR